MVRFYFHENHWNGERPAWLSEADLSLGDISDSKVLFFFDTTLAKKLNRTGIQHAHRLLRNTLLGALLLPLFLVLFRAALVLAAHGGSQAKGLIEATAASLCQSHGSARSELPLWRTPQLMATPDP